MEKEREKNEKTRYETPETALYELKTEDIITTSSLGKIEEDDPNQLDWI